MVRRRVAGLPASTCRTARVVRRWDGFSRFIKLPGGAGSVMNGHFIDQGLLFARLERHHKFHLRDVDFFVGRGGSETPISLKVAANVGRNRDLLGVLQLY